MKLGSTDISKIYLGSTEVTKAYLGSVQVHGGSSPTPVLPYDAEVEWLKSSGTQYFDMDVILTNNSSVEIGLTSLGMQASVFGYSGNGKGVICAAGGTNDIMVLDFYGNSDYTTYRLINTDTISQKVVCNKNVRGIYDLLSGAIIAENTAEYQGAFTCDASAYLLAASGSPYFSAKCSCKLYYCKVSENGVLVRDFIPVVKNNVGYLYDKVSGTLFANAGTGSFEVGPVKGNLPYDAVVEWIKTDGSAYIDTGIVGKCRFAFIGGINRSITSASAMFGSRVDGTHNAFSILWYGDASSNAGKVRFDMGTGGSSAKYTSSSVSNDTRLAYDGSKFYAGSQSITPSYNSQSPSAGNHYVLAINSNGTTTFFDAGGYVKSLNMHWSGTTLRDYIPVRVGQIGYLYDRVSGTLFGNANSSGAFIIGNDITNN